MATTPNFSRMLKILLPVFALGLSAGAAASEGPPESLYDVTPLASTTDPHTPPCVTLIKSALQHRKIAGQKANDLVSVVEQIKEIQLAAFDLQLAESVCKRERPTIYQPHTGVAGAIWPFPTDDPNYAPPDSAK